MDNYIKTKYNKLKQLQNKFSIIKHEIEFTNTPTNGMEEFELDELYGEFEDIRINIELLKRFLITIKRTSKFKQELIDTSNLILYNPSRVSRLLDNQLISFNNNSFDNL